MAEEKIVHHVGEERTHLLFDYEASKGELEQAFANGVSYAGIGSRVAGQALSMSRPSTLPVDDHVHPFKVIRFPLGGAMHWGIHLPKGCVYVDAEEVGFDTMTKVYKNVYDVDSPVPGDDIYLYITEEEDSDGVSFYRGVIGSSASPVEDARWSILVATYDSETFQISQVLQSTLCLSSGDEVEVDDRSIDKEGTRTNLKQDGTLGDPTPHCLEIKGWKTKDKESQTLAQILGISDKNPSGDTGHVLVRQDKGISAKYVEMGEANLGVKNISYSGESGSRTYIATFFDADKQSVSWQEGGGSCPDITVSETGSGNVITAITVNSTNKHQLDVTWGTVSGGSSLSGTVTFVTNVGYNLSTHCLQKQTATLDLATGDVTDNGWTNIINGQCIAHSSIASN